LNSSYQSTSTTPQSSSQQSSSTQYQQSSSSQQSLMSPIIIDPVDRDIIIRSRSNTPIIPIEPTPTEGQQSGLSTPIVEPPIDEPAQSQYSEPQIADRLTNIETMLIKQGKQIRILYELQKTSLERISSLHAQVKKLNSDKINELSLKVLNVSNNLVCIILSYLDI
jgi:hypothetical protein